jgi:conjugal transfer ATP-binding protein TraC
VFELSDLASREELRSVVLSAIMFLSSQAMREDRATARRCCSMKRGRC